MQQKKNSSSTNRENLDENTSWNKKMGLEVGRESYGN